MSSRLHVQKKEAVALRQNRDYTNKKTQIIGVFLTLSFHKVSKLQNKTFQKQLSKKHNLHPLKWQFVKS